MDRSDAVARFTRMEDGTKEDFETLERIQEPFANELADRVLEQLRQLGGSYGGMLVDRLIHSLQTATRAHRDGRDEEYVVCALLHDIGDMLASHNHADLAAAILKPFVSEKNLWIVQHHAIFQGYYFWHHVGADRNAREKFRDHPHFDDTAEFCALYDQCSFDPDYDTLPLETFEPMLRRVFEKPKWTEYGT
ncbi:MAG: HD domain-containing protein [Deltaproteobacteria bacterium]|nr:HD domain-containing protein [Deltaproteobacteria bacterium]MBW2692308.1 HD domain-containing protein [Deltaproteobacteria bacterium]